MAQPAISPDRLPRWVVLVGSVLIVFHLIAVLALALAVPSGPWPTSFGASMSEEPRFVRIINELTARYYLRPLHLAQDFHFSSNRNDVPVVKFEVRLRDRVGNLLQTVRLPDEGASSWSRQYQKRLALGLGDDQPVQPPRGEVIPAPGRNVKTVTIWDAAPSDPTLRLRELPHHLVPRDRPVYRPSEWSQVLARAFTHYLGRQYAAASAEVIRHSREPILPAVMFSAAPLPGAFEELVCSFGEQQLGNEPR